ncbi:hypothetical protein CP97_00105 [Aurantiacibacter atlanticus]|uniref:Uncharacterized protein n=1 Tax=Aurantiacibacter atlanticus TaxID=1648404 RepID=A0A0H4V873_9SPHN|nr:hypothetical protein CP97_00105 [Aurantiacibacter atlanticus]
MIVAAGKCIDRRGLLTLAKVRRMMFASLTEWIACTAAF